MTRNPQINRRFCMADEAIFFPIKQPFRRGGVPCAGACTDKIHGQNINFADYIRTKMRCRYIQAQINHKTKSTETDSAIGP